MRKMIVFIFCLTIILYKTPEGLLRFPDGGQPNTVHEGVYLISSGSGEEEKLFTMQKLVKKNRSSDCIYYSFK